MRRRPRELVLAAAFAAVSTGCPAPPSDRPDRAEVAGAAARPATAAPAPSVGPGPVWIGVIAPAQTVDLAPAFDGFLAEVTVRPGDRVEPGAVVARLDQRPLREELRAARDALRESRARASRSAVDVRIARHRLAHEERAVADGISPRVAVEEARFAVEAARAARREASATVAQARSQVRRAAARLADTAIRAPFAGAVAARHRDPGAPVGPGSPVVRVIAGAELRLRFAVPPEAAGDVAVGREVLAEIDTVAAPITAVVEQVAAEVDLPSRMIFVVAAVTPASAGRLRPGLAARVRPGAARAQGGTP